MIVACASCSIPNEFVVSPTITHVRCYKCSTVTVIKTSYSSTSSSDPPKPVHNVRIIIPPLLTPFQDEEKQRTSYSYVPSKPERFSPYGDVPSSSTNSSSTNSSSTKSSSTSHSHSASSAPPPTQSSSSTQSQSNGYSHNSNYSRTSKVSSMIVHRVSNSVTVPPKKKEKDNEYYTILGVEPTASAA
jgi:hypothetical protein